MYLIHTTAHIYIVINLHMHLIHTLQLHTFETCVYLYSKRDIYTYLHLITYTVRGSLKCIYI